MGERTWPDEQGYSPHPPGTRVYCYRTGDVHTLVDGITCPECGRFGVRHRAVAPDMCRSYVRCSIPRCYGTDRRTRDHGHPCVREIGHEGDCRHGDGT